MVGPDDHISRSSQFVPGAGDAPAATAPPRLSVVIPCRNAAGTLGRQLGALADQAWEGSWEVVVSDNGSNDGSAEVARRFANRLPNLQVVDASQRRGQAHARNVGARASKGDALLFVDADDEVAPGYLAAMATALTSHSFVAARYDFDTLNSGWIRASRTGVQSDGLSNPFALLPYSGGGGLGIHRAAFDAVGGFDPDYWRSGQDIDFCWRVQLSGVELMFVPDATVRIGLRGTLREMYRQGRHYGRGEAYLYRRYRDRGMHALSVSEGLHEWRLMASRLVRVRRRGGAARWLRDLGRRVGRLQGSLRHRVFFP